MRKTNRFVRIVSMMLALLLAVIMLASCNETTVIQGKSAYELAVEAGFEGTLEEWLESLKGDKGDKGDTGEAGAKGDKGDTGAKGNDGKDAIAPQVRINATTKKWEISTNGGLTWQSTNVSATGAKGEDGNDAVAPQVRINEQTNKWEISTDGGVTWNTTNVSATGKSAYELAQEQGFEGTLEEWLESLGSKTETQIKAEKLRELMDLKHELRVDENGNFKVLYFGDVQFTGSSVGAETKAYMKMLVDRENPDLVLFLGDNHYGGRVTEQGLRSYIADMVGYIEEKQIPWAHVYGNHDADTQHTGYLTKEVQQRIYESFDYCISKAGDEELFGVGNYVLPVLSNDGQRIEFAIYALDTGSYRSTAISDVVMSDNTFFGKYEAMQENQVEWYKQTSELLAEFNGANVPGMMYFHIPLQETYTAWSQRETLNLEYTGKQGENICAPAYNAGLFDAIKARGDVQIIVNGHDHINDFSVKYQGVRFCYNASIGTKEYHDDDMLGGRVVTYTGIAADAFHTYMSYVIERPADNVLADLKVNAGDETVTNGAGLPSIDLHEMTGSSVQITTDSGIGRDVVTFLPTASGETTAYFLDAAALNDTLRNGFSYEVYFKPTGAVTSSYKGVIDYEEKGGFGLNIYPGSSADKVELRAEIAVKDGNSYTWVKIICEVALNEWYHCVYSYNGSDKVAFYVNGELVGEQTLTTEMVMPRVSYIAIGACADGNKTTAEGMEGIIALCKVYGVATTKSQAWNMFSAVANPPILDLVIDANGQTVSNGSAGAPGVTLFEKDNSSVTIEKDTEIGRDVLTFTPNSSGTSATTAYLMSSASLHDDLADGFSYEVYFKPTAAVTSTYTGVLDYEESGGFGLNLYPGSSASTVKLHAEIAVKNGSGRMWIELVAEIPVNEWCHCVFSYNGSDSISLYVNGERVTDTIVDEEPYEGEYTLTTPMKMPDFGSKTPYICIGACTAARTGTTMGMEGSIAICNIYSTPTLASIAEQMYQAAVSK